MLSLFDPVSQTIITLLKQQIKASEADSGIKIKVFFLDYRRFVYASAEISLDDHTCGWLRRIALLI